MGPGPITVRARARDRYINVVQESAARAARDAGMIIATRSYHDHG